MARDTASEAALHEKTRDEPPRDVPDFVSNSTLRNFPFPMVLTDPRQDDNPIVYVNAAFTKVTGYAFEAAVGRNCRFLQGEDTDPASVNTLREAIAASDEITLDLVNYHADGKPFHNRLMICPLRDEAGELIYFLGVQTRVEHEASPFARAFALTEQLRELQHRVKNHLAMVLALIRAEARERPPDQVIDVLVQRIEAISLLYDTLSSTGNGASETVNLGAYLSRVASALQLIDNRGGIIVNVEVDDITVDVSLAEQIGLILSEVMTNALRHGLADRGTGVIDLRLSKDGDAALLVLRDDGRGMGDARWPEGDSLGSRIVRDLVARSQSDLNVQSDGAGTRIELRIPV